MLKGVDWFGYVGVVCVGRDRVRGTRTPNSPFPTPFVLQCKSQSLRLVIVKTVREGWCSRRVDRREGGVKWLQVQLRGGEYI